MTLANPWAIPDNAPSNPDCFVVLSYAVKNRFIPTNPTKAAIKLAYKWWQRFPHAAVICSTGDNQGLGIPNSRVMAEYAVRIGIPIEQIIQESESLTTHGNLLHSIQIIKQHHFKEPTLVTFDLHTRRAVAIARRLGWTDCYWISAYAKGEPAYGHKWLQTHSRFTALLYEIAAMLFNKIRREA